MDPSWKYIQTRVVSEHPKRVPSYYINLMETEEILQNHLSSFKSLHFSPRNLKTMVFFIKLASFIDPSCLCSFPCFALHFIYPVYHFLFILSYFFHLQLVYHLTFNLPYLFHLCFIFVSNSHWF
jgi:hypothetical protein